MKTYDRATLGRAFGITCKTLRQRAGISQENLARAAGVGRAHLSKIERGLGNPRMITIFKLVPHLKVDFHAFGVELDANLRKRPAAPRKRKAS